MSTRAEAMQTLGIVLVVVGVAQWSWALALVLAGAAFITLAQGVR